MTDFITDQRTEIFDNNNTAQQQIADLLDTLNDDKSEINLILETSLHGDIDLAILGSKGFHHIKNIVFIEGQITSIQNIPKSVKSLIISNNLLIEMPSPLDHVESIDVKSNYLTVVDLQSAKHLKKCVMSFNRITEVKHIPSSIRELYCMNNDIRVLDLEAADKIYTLYCSNNPHLLVEHFPDSLKDFRMENTQFQEIYQNLGNVQLDSKHTNDHNRKIDYLDALNQYFRLKQKYDTKVYAIKKREYEKLRDKRTPKSKIRRILSNIKIPCVNCSQSSGTIFDLKTTDDGRIYSAICGNRKKPCNLNIQLSTGQFMNIWNSMETAKYYLSEYKEKIIKHKLDVLFNYLGETTAAVEFKTDLEEYYATKELYEHAVQKYTAMYHNPETEENIKAKSIILFDKLEEMEKIMMQYRESISTSPLGATGEILKDAMNVYFREIMDLSKQVYDLKHRMSEMYEDEKHPNIFFLKQWPITLSSMDYSYDNVPEVVKFTKLGK